MAEAGIDIAANTPKVLTVDAVKASDVVITMGCGDTCPIFPGKRYEDWARTSRRSAGCATTFAVASGLSPCGRSSCYSDDPGSSGESVCPS